METLYYSSNSCAMSVHIALETVGKSYEAMNVADMGEEYAKINPNGGVPVMVIDGGDLMTQNEALLKYIAQKYPESGIGGDGSLEQTYQINKWLAFVGGDLHPSHGGAFHADMLTTQTDEASLNAIKEASVKLIRSQLSKMEAGLEGKKYLVGEKITIADMYAFPVSRWYSMLTGGVMDEFPNIAAYQDRMAENQAVKNVLAVHNPQ